MPKVAVKLDDRAGSKELYSPLLMVGLGVELCRLPFGDIAFEGRGPDECPVLIGIEHKQVADVIQCIGNGRFAGHQLPGLVETYNYVWLYIEGETRCGKDGRLQIKHESGRWFDAGHGGNRNFSYREFVAYLFTLTIKGGIHTVCTRDQQDTAHSISTLAHWWTSKDYDSHRSHLAFDTTNDLHSALLVRPNLVRRVAKELPGVGWQKSMAVAAAFPTVVEMVAAEQDEWEGVEGIGKTMAGRIRKELGWRE